ncbi:coenzyme F390 synthetase FtsA [Legionella moravica]|uniref:Coenzyme F390 synthetase FtsA n=1 Tax=Legionella moravica TaxID=39962 RepID=A0A378JW60_9GAMM|nr:F390 synthetase-related protein [Legionella moravica]KTD35212.1 coenzyme F390 synthetase FtsA [Legionella moravica]STX62666.1 coenzyme F390 synthetase FtsA [Legionella moravica]
MIVRIVYYYFKTLFLQRWFTSRDQLLRYQQKKFKALVKNTLSKSPFYKDYLDKPFEQWPVINKNIMMEHFDSINTLRIKKSDALKVALNAEQSRDFSALIGNIAVGLSSGTSTQRGLFLVSNKERSMWAGILLAKVLPSGLKTNERIAFFLRANNRLYMTLNKSRRIQFTFFDLLDDFDTQIDQLNTLQPTILSAPASVLVALSRQIIRLNISPKKIFSVAEVLDKHDEALIQKAFKCQVSQVYQCTEGFLAVSDKQTNHLTMNEEFLIIEKEWVDEHRFIPIITDLLRTTQPMIRYRLDDVLVEDQSGHVFTRLSTIEGRVGDICYGVKEDKVIPVFADLIRQQMASFPFDFDDYRITQHAFNEFKIQTLPEISEKEALVLHLNQLFESKGCELPVWIWSQFEDNSRGVKTRRIQCIMDNKPLQ